MTLEGDRVVAFLHDGACDNFGMNFEGLSAYCSIHKVGDYEKVIAKFEVTFTSWETVEEERKMVKRLVTSAVKKLDALYA
jgi:hypothetical protein